MALSDDAIIAMARDANPEHDLTAMLPFLSRFAALVKARERAMRLPALMASRAAPKFIEFMVFSGGDPGIRPGRYYWPGFSMGSDIIRVARSRACQLLIVSAAVSE